MVTNDQLRAIMPHLAAAKAQVCLPCLVAAMDEFAIASPPRMAAFLAQVAHESGELRFMQELWGPTPAQRRYEPASPLATTLGNTEPGDGAKFKGRGPIQITGRANYRRFGDLLSIDLVADPARAALPEVGFRIAALFWSKKGLNELADEATADAFREITRRINGGFNGLAEREQFYAVARTVLDVTAPPVTRGGPPRPRGSEPEFLRGYEAIQGEAQRQPARKRKRGVRTPKRAAATRKGKRVAPKPRKRAVAKRQASPTRRRKRSKR
jgi:predicted chitinase